MYDVIERYLSLERPVYQPINDVTRDQSDPLSTTYKGNLDPNGDIAILLRVAFGESFPLQGITFKTFLAVRSTRQTVEDHRPFYKVSDRGSFTSGRTTHFGYFQLCTKCNDVASNCDFKGQTKIERKETSNEMLVLAFPFPHFHSGSTLTIIFERCVVPNEVNPSKEDLEGRVKIRIRGLDPIVNKILWHPDFDAIVSNLNSRELPEISEAEVKKPKPKKQEQTRVFTTEERDAPPPRAPPPVRRSDSLPLGTVSWTDVQRAQRGIGNGGSWPPRANGREIAAQRLAEKLKRRT